MLNLYYSFPHSYLLYGLKIWGSNYHSYLNKRSKLQSKALKIGNGSKLSVSPAAIHFSLHILTLSQMITFEIAKVIFKYKNNRLPLIFNHHFSKLEHSCNKVQSKWNFQIFVYLNQGKLNSPSNIHGQKFGTLFPLIGHQIKTLKISNQVYTWNNFNDYY